MEELGKKGAAEGEPDEGCLQWCSEAAVARLSRNRSEVQQECSDSLLISLLLRSWWE